MPISAISASWLRILRGLPENHRRWIAAEKALEMGYGGIRLVHQATKLSEVTIRRGIQELKSRKRLEDPARIRRAGGGRKRLSDIDGPLVRDLERIVSETTAGDPMSPLRWTLKSTRRIAGELRRAGHTASPMTVSRLLNEQDYSLQSNRKTIEGGDHPDRDAQFRYIASLVKKTMAGGEPVLSVDAKKRELVGNFKNAGRAYRKKGSPRKVNAYDFRSEAEGIALPYGLFDQKRNHGFVNVGISRETNEFAVESLRQWWRHVGRRHYPKAKALLICADGGGSNGSRNRGWRLHLQHFSNETGLEVTVCHYPPGTSKWNKIEHRMFSYISMNWREKPLVDYATVISLIGNTTTQTGLKIDARLDRSEYEKGLKVTDKQMAALNLTAHAKHPRWNYTIGPQA